MQTHCFRCTRSLWEDLGWQLGDVTCSSPSSTWWHPPGSGCRWLSQRHPSHCQRWWRKWIWHSRRCLCRSLSLSPLACLSPGSQRKWNHRNLYEKEEGNDLFFYQMRKTTVCNALYQYALCQELSRLKKKHQTLSTKNNKRGGATYSWQT